MEELFAGAPEPLITFFAGMLIVAVILAIIIGVAIYIYTSLAYMKIGQKAKLKTPELAWIPGIGPTILAYQASKMHWWPWLLLIGLLIPYADIIAAITFTVFTYIWMWKLYEKIKRPGWWPLIGLIPIIGTIAYLVLVGIAAWGKD